jgi:hypothetical protein
METIWTGILLAIGLAIGYLILTFAVGLIFSIRNIFRAVRFSCAGCVYQPAQSPGAPSGWLIRDIRNDDWVIWDEKNNRVMRVNDGAAPNEPWTISTETLKEFLKLAHSEKEFWNKRTGDGD